MMHSVHAYVNKYAFKQLVNGIILCSLFFVVEKRNHFIMKVCTVKKYTPKNNT